METIPFTPKELMDLYKPRIWFRRELIEKPQEEWDKNPHLALRVNILHEQAQVLTYELKRGEISQKDYDKSMRQVRKDIGNLLYF